MATWLRTGLWLTLGIWLGAWALFALVVAPTAFRVLPSVDVAGDLVGPVLRSLHLYGLAAGFILAGIGATSASGRACVVLPLLLALLCGVSEFGVTAAISDVLPGDFGPETSSDAAARFHSLHQLSRLLFAVVGAGLIALVWLHARQEAAPRSRLQARL
jgi:hypothetical protein